MIKYVEMFKAVYELYKAYKAGKKGEALIENSSNVITRMIVQAKVGEKKLVQALVVNDNHIDNLYRQSAKYGDSIKTADRLIAKLSELVK
jgi:hypothetical protein